MSVGRVFRQSLALLSIAGSMLIAVVFVAHSFGVRNVLTALTQVNPWLLAVVVILGGLIQVVRAQRARCLLSSEREVHLRHAYGAMVIAHGLGDFIPVAPGGPALRCFLTKRLSDIPMAFSAGTFMVEGLLDGLGPSLLIVYLLLILSMPTWVRWILIAALVQSSLIFIVPSLIRSLAHSRGRRPPGGDRLNRLWCVGCQLADGFGSVASRGPRTAWPVASLSLLVTGISCLQTLFFLRACGLTVPFNEVLLVLVLTLVTGSIPLKLPGSGTLATVGVLRIAGIHGAGLGGYIVLSRVVFSSETAVLALLLLSWWGLTGQARELRLSRLPPTYHGTTCRQ